MFPVQYAAVMPLSGDYYKMQFEHLLNERPDYVTFLYTIKLCYELGSERTLNKIRQLHMEIFENKPPENALKDLSIWIYPSVGSGGMQYALHDLPLSSINYTYDIESTRLR
jgi:hypothetical protein